MRKRSKYRPKPVRADTIGYVMESLSPLVKQDKFMITLKLRNSAAMVSLLRGSATKDDMSDIIAMSNFTEALLDLGFGTEHREVAISAREAIIAITLRAQELQGRFVPKGLEIQALNDLMELHDAQLEVITLQDMTRAYAFISEKIRNKKAFYLKEFPDAD